MKDNEIIKGLDSFWDVDNGFFLKVRDGIFDMNNAETVIYFLKKIDLEDQKYIDKEIITLLWFIPTFLEYNSHWFSDNVKFESVKNKISNEIMRILGVP